MAVARDDLGKAARKRGIEGQITIRRTEKDGAARRILGRSTKLMKTNFRDRGKFVTKCKVYHHETGCLKSALLEGALTKVGFTRHLLFIVSQVTRNLSENGFLR